MMNEDDRDAGARRMLARIADVLGVPVARFYEPDDATAPVICTDPREIALVRLFRTLPDDGDRQRCLDLIRQIVSRP
jgi:hypothetical protein